MTEKERKLFDALLRFYVAWFVGFDIVTSREEVRDCLIGSGYRLDHLIDDYIASIQPQIDRFNERIQGQNERNSQHD